MKKPSLSGVVSCETFYNILNSVLNPYSIFIDLETAKKLVLFWELFSKWNKSHNLSSVTDFDKAIYLHFADSFFPAAEKELFANKGNVLDLGTGGGFPGIPLSLLFKENNFFLLDKSRKKTSFLSVAAAQINLQNVTAVNSELKNHSDRKYDIILSRAVKIDEELFELCKKLLNKEGWLVFYYSKNQLPLKNEFLHHTAQYVLPDRTTFIAYYHF
ncbi:MAG: 16S rRNA (guanine(527)-N(7))-methyltransferase RsmG [bacterium]